MILILAYMLYGSHLEPIKFMVNLQAIFDAGKFDAVTIENLLMDSKLSGRSYFHLRTWVQSPINLINTSFINCT